MNYRSVSDLSTLTNRFASKVPTDVDLVVGIPRSGMLVASIVALKLNLPLTDLYSFERNDELKKGHTRTYKHEALRLPQQARKILLVDDSIASGGSMREARDKVSKVFAGEVVTMVAFAQRNNAEAVDIFLETVEQPRVFEWNIMHHALISHSCLDIDGVLCVDPTRSQNDDGENYLGFLEHAQPLFIPSIEVKHLVTSRLEKYRAETEAWLERHGVRYQQLHMLDLPSAAERRRLDMHKQFKADIYRGDPHAVLFIENEERQAWEIMRLTGKPVFCLETNEMYAPGASLSSLKAQTVRKSLSFRDKVMGRIKRFMTRHLQLTP
ncbi:phosphoribosyltransferase [Pseudomonas sp. gcc21]|uniref:phosphoribosyltransferase n=1 Tax=Pseudomonas sp. gcc21 TaxID=2726989 RepID=UPI001452A331|nr:phosphoribosyltransferase family protein [Pseudomonas sp. gcc21]QJD59693.1 phosphoribosyltransferase [Pseudomonas sp. gcc21]